MKIIVLRSFKVAEVEVNKIWNKIVQQGILQSARQKLKAVYKVFFHLIQTPGVQ